MDSNGLQKKKRPEINLLDLCIKICGFFVLHERSAAVVFTLSYTRRHGFYLDSMKLRFSQKFNKKYLLTFVILYEK